MATTTSNTAQVFYRDMDMNFTAHPLKSDISLKLNVDSIRQALITLFYLDKYDIPFDQNAYSNMTKYLFEPLNIITSSNIESRIRWLITKYEKRIVVLGVNVVVNQEEDGYDITVVYRVKDLNIEDSLQYFFSRVR